MGVCDDLLHLLENSKKTVKDSNKIRNLKCKETALIAYGISYNHILYAGILDKIDNNYVHFNPGLEMHFAKNCELYPFVYWTNKQINIDDLELFYELENKYEFVEKLSFINIHNNYLDKIHQLAWDNILTGIVYDDDIYEVKDIDDGTTRLDFKNEPLSDKDFHNKMVELVDFLRENII